MIKLDPIRIKEENGFTQRNGNSLTHITPLPIYSSMNPKGMAPVAKANQYDDDDDDDEMEGGDDEIMGNSNSKESTVGRWTREEHLLFIKGLELYGKGWKKIAGLIKTRTVVQIRTHAQKYFLKLAKARQSGEGSGSLSMDGKPLGHRKKRKRRLFKNIAVAPPLQPYVKQPPNSEANAIDVDDSLYNFLSPELPSFPLASEISETQPSEGMTAAFPGATNYENMSISNGGNLMESVVTIDCSTGKNSDRDPLNMSLSAIADEVLHSLRNDESFMMDVVSTISSMNEHGDDAPVPETKNDSSVPEKVLTIEEKTESEIGKLNDESRIVNSASSVLSVISSLNDESAFDSISDSKMQETEQVEAGNNQVEVESSISSTHQEGLISPRNIEETAHEKILDNSMQEGKFSSEQSMLIDNHHSISSNNVNNMASATNAELGNKSRANFSAMYSDIPLWYQKGLRVEYLLEAAESVNWLQDTGFVNPPPGAVTFETIKKSHIGTASSTPRTNEQGDISKSNRPMSVSMNKAEKKGNSTESKGLRPSNSVTNFLKEDLSIEEERSLFNQLYNNPMEFDEQLDHDFANNYDINTWNDVSHHYFISDNSADVTTSPTNRRRVSKATTSSNTVDDNDHDRPFIYRNPSLAELNPSMLPDADEDLWLQGDAYGLNAAYDNSFNKDDLMMDDSYFMDDYLNDTFDIVATNHENASNARRTQKPKGRNHSSNAGSGTPKASAAASNGFSNGTTTKKINSNKSENLTLVIPTASDKKKNNPKKAK